jgi:hypothetical protein
VLSTPLTSAIPECYLAAFVEVGICTLNHESSLQSLSQDFFRGMRENCDSPKWRRQSMLRIQQLVGSSDKLSYCGTVCAVLLKSTISLSERNASRTDCVAILFISRLTSLTSLDCAAAIITSCRSSSWPKGDGPGARFLMLIVKHYRTHLNRRPVQY